MQLLASSSEQVLLIKARQKLGMTQREFARAVGSSLRTVARWEGASSVPGPWHYHTLAVLLHPLDPALARDAAHLGGKTLEELVAGAPPAPPAPERSSLAAGLASSSAGAHAALPVRILVDAVVFAAARALESSPPTFDTVRAAVQAAFAHARDLRLAPAEVVEALTPPALAVAPSRGPGSPRKDGGRRPR